MDRKRLSIVIVVVLALVVLLLSRCQPEDEFPDPEHNERQPLPLAQQRPEVTIETGQALISGQIMLTGEAEDIGNVVNILAETRQLRLRPVVTTTFDFLAEYPPPNRDEFDIRQQSLGKRQRAVDPLAGRLQDLPSLQIGLFEFPEETHSLSETLELIATVVLSPEVELPTDVVAEPNYVTGFEITGAPWGVEGSPWGVEGSPGSGTDPSNAEDYASYDFWEQWALHAPPGINLFNGATPPEGRTVEEFDGEGVQVAVFDTSPFDAEGDYTFADWGPDSPNPLKVTVSHLLAEPESEPNTDPVDIADHGLFVSGLVYAVAPASDIYLLQVLNAQGQGEVQGLIDAMNVYMSDRLAVSSGSLERTVINLSLGSHAPDEEELPEAARQQIALMLKAWGYDVPDEGPLPVLALDVMMRLFDIYGASVIAASGNHSADEPQPLPPQFPAAFSTVVGVTASSKDQLQSCYANNGDLMAPGGDGGPGDVDLDGIIDATPTPPAVAEDVCLPTHSTCAGDGPNCGFGVVSYTRKVHKGFAYWVGTSFATPLVSGLAANLIQAGATSPTQVREALLCSAQGPSVVDAVMARDALSGCPPP